MSYSPPGGLADARSHPETPEDTMGDLWNHPPTTRDSRADCGMRRGRPGELLSITLDMLAIGSVSLVGCALTGIADHITLAAMGIAVYISGKHFNHLREEIAALRE